jgi:hypothetical protein
MLAASFAGDRPTKCRGRPAQPTIIPPRGGRRGDAQHSVQFKSSVVGSHPSEHTLPRAHALDDRSRREGAANNCRRSSACCVSCSFGQYTSCWFVPSTTNTTQTTDRTILGRGSLPSPPLSRPTIGRVRQTQHASRGKRAPLPPTASHPWGGAASRRRGSASLVRRSASVQSSPPPLMLDPRQGHAWRARAHLRRAWTGLQRRAVAATTRRGGWALPIAVDRQDESLLLLLLERVPCVSCWRFGSTLPASPLLQQVL